jgi:hypothetical protein
MMEDSESMGPVVKISQVSLRVTECARFGALLLLVYHVSLCVIARRTVTLRDGWPRVPGMQIVAKAGNRTGRQTKPM